jgi:FlaG/FlaF family flagellin (archaellin)
MSMKPSSAAFAAAFSLLVMGTTQLYAQAVSNATVTGRVTDEQAAVVPNAQIQITAAETGARYNTVHLKHLGGILL